MIPAPGAPLDWLFLDLNSYFASVEQQENPRLRGKPVAVVPVETDFTCAIAASYEAKAFGIKTGTGIREAKQKCPSIALVLARHDVYVRYHHRVLEEVDRHLPIHNVASIDEMACRLTGKWREPANALVLAKEIKAGLGRNVGECIRCSIGLSTNRYLAKVATDLQKPDGLVILHPDDLPGRLMESELRDFPGIGRNMEARLNRAGIHTFEQLWACEPKRLRAAWGSVHGERFWHALRGVEIADEETNPGSVGHSHVLSPEERPPAMAERVTRRLLLKAASRLRRMEHVAECLHVAVRMESGARLEDARKFPPLSDSVTLQECFTEMWAGLAREIGRQRIKKTSVTLTGLSPVASHTQLELFAGGPSAEALEKRARLSRVLDGLTGKFGRDAVTIGIAPGEGASFTGTKIAFTRVPEPEDFDEK
jgi:DNA polymerase-4